jgi:hypothetical protein
LVVANNGWPIERYRCPGPLPPAVPLASAVNYWVSRRSSLIAPGGTSLTAVGPDRAALDRVRSRRKPLGMADTKSCRLAERWEAEALQAGLGVRVAETDFGALDGGRVWFVTVARKESFADLFDLHALRLWYVDAILAAGAEGLTPRVNASLTKLERQSPADYLDRVDDLIMAPFGDLEETDCTTEVVGVVLGYWPPTSAAMIASCAADRVGCQRYETKRFPLWDDLRWAAVERLERAEQAA